MKAAPFLKKFTPVAGIFIVLMTIWSILSEIWISFPPWPSGLFAWFAAFLLVSQLSKSQTLQIGILLTDRYRVKTSRPKTTCSNVCLKIRNTHRNCQQGYYPASCRPLNNSTVSREGLWYWSNQVDRNALRIALFQRAGNSPRPYGKQEQSKLEA